MAIRTFLFDLGNVLVRFSHEKMFRQLGEICERSPAEIITFASSTGLLYDYETGRVDDQGFHAAFERWLGRSIPAEPFLEAGSDIFDLNEPMNEVLAELKERDYRLVLLSNTCPAHFQKVSSSWSFLDLFDHLVLSYRVGAMKPEDGIYQAALEAIDCAPAECLYTDDIEPYVEIGKSVGLDAVLFTTPERFAHDLAERGIVLKSVAR